LFCLSIAQDPSEGQEDPWLKVMWVSLKVRSVYANPEENFCFNTCVLLRRESIEETPDLNLLSLALLRG
jgi:hypothetical protein